MNKTNELNHPEEALAAEAYPKAMNLIGQNLHNSLVQSIQSLPAAVRKNEVVLQGVAAFFSNVLHQQFPKDASARQEMLEHFSKIVGVHLAEMAKHHA